MAVIQDIKDVHELRGRWSSLFTSKDPFVYPFAASVQSSSVFYPTEGYHLSNDQYKAVVNSAKAVGDVGFIISIVEWNQDFFTQGKHWFCHFPSYEEYSDLPITLENALYSSSFVWGLLISHEEHAVVGGSRDFITSVRKHYQVDPGNISKDVDELREYWRTNVHNAWVPPLIASLLIRR